MDPHQGQGRSRPMSLSGAAAEMNRRRAFLQNFTPAFNIGAQPSRLPSAETVQQFSSPSTSNTSTSRSPSLSPVRGMRQTLHQQINYVDSSELDSTPEASSISVDQEYEDYLEEDGLDGEDEDPGFEEIDITEDDIRQAELQGVDIDEVEDVEALEEEEFDEEAMQGYDARYASQDDYMYDDEEFEEEPLEDEPMPSTSFGQMHHSGLSIDTSHSSLKSRNTSRLEAWGQHSHDAQMYTQDLSAEEVRRRMKEVAEEWGNDSEDEDDLEILEETSEQGNIWKEQQSSKPGRNQLAPQQTLKVKPTISPDICDGIRSTSEFETSGNDDLNEDSDVEVLEHGGVTITATRKALPQKRSIKDGPVPANPNRIRLSFVHASSSSPEKRPRYTVAPAREDSNDADSNDVEDDQSCDTFDTPKIPKKGKEGARRRAGRPRKQPKELGNDDDNSTNLESADDSKDVLGSSKTSTTDGTRRTGRTRIPTKQFVINFGGRSSNDSSPRKGHNKELDTDSEHDRRLTMTFKNIGDSVARGRGSGKTRGRPKGATSRLRTHATACMENIVQEVLVNKPQITSADEVEMKSEISDIEGNEDIPTKVADKKTSRGGRRVGTPKTPKVKVKKIAKTKPAEIVDENAMTGYAKLKDDFDNSVDSFGLGDDDTRLSNGNFSFASPSNSNLEFDTPKTKKIKNVEAFLGESKPVTAETLYDYSWPREGKSERFILQEQLSEFLGVTSFRRKYPELKRRVVDMEERDFLRREKIVTEVQCDLGLTALPFDDVLPILSSDFRSKYIELEEVWVRRMEMERKKVETRPVERLPLKLKPEDIRKTLLRSTAEWNSALNRDRQVERSRSMDLQTFTIHEQTGRTQKFIAPPGETKTGYFPTPALVGQFVDTNQIPKYTAEELKYLPVNTPVYGPIPALNSVRDSEDSESDSDDSSSTDDTSSSSDITCKQEPSSDLEDAAANTEKCTPLIVGGEGNLGGPEAMNVICKSCNGGIANNKDSVPEMIIHCTKCKVPNHPSCLELSYDMLPTILKYNWQCTDCKNCIECNDPADEDKMLFCDLCDRGYHIYCVGLRKVPTGRWHCRVCAICYSCGTKTPSEEDRLAEWHHEFKKGDKSSKFYLHSQCVNCHKLYKKGQYCPCCLKVHQTLPDKSLTECRTCEKWVHAECIKSKPVAPGTMFGFRCDACEATFKTRTKIRTPFGSCP